MNLSESRLLSRALPRLSSRMFHLVMIRQASNLLLLLGLVIALFGCAATDIDLGAAPAAEKLGFTITDERSEESKKYLYNPCHVSPVTRLGDENFTPRRLELFAFKLNESLGERLEGKQITIERFDTVVLRTKSCQAQDIVGIASFMGIWLSPALDPYVMGMLMGYDILERDGDAVLCSIDGAVDGLPFHGRSMVGARESSMDKTGVDGRQEEISAAVDQAIDMSLEEIDRQLRAATDTESP